MSAVDPTRVIESLARRLGARRAEHPVAGALAQAARGRARLDQAGFAARVGVSVELVRACERGDVPLGDLPSRLGSLALELDADLLGLADLERRLRSGSPPSAAGL